MEAEHMAQPSSLDEAVACLANSLDESHVRRIRDTPPEKVEELYDEYESYVLDTWGLFCPDLLAEIGAQSNEQGRRAGARFLIHLLHRELRHRQSGG